RRGSARSAGDAFRGPLGFASPPEATSTRPDPALCPSFPRPLCTSGARAWKTPGTSGGKPPVARGLKLLQTGKRWRRCALRKRARRGDRRPGGRATYVAVLNYFEVVNEILAPPALRRCRVSHAPAVEPSSDRRRRSSEGDAFRRACSPGRFGSR